MLRPDWLQRLRRLLRLLRLGRPLRDLLVRRHRPAGWLHWLLRLVRRPAEGSRLDRQTAPRAGTDAGLIL